MRYDAFELGPVVAASAGVLAVELLYFERRSIIEGVRGVRERI